MQAQIYPTAPADMAQHEAAVPVPPSVNAEGEQHAVESPGKTKAVLSKMKDKARKLKEKIKKITNTSSGKDATDHDDLDQHSNEEELLHQPGHEEEEEEGADVYEDDEEEDDHINQVDNQLLKYEQLRPRASLDKEGGGSEVEVHGGVPVSAAAATPGTYWKTENEDHPISPYKSAGPPDALQAAPTQYHYYNLDDGSTDPHPSLEGVSEDAQVKPSSDFNVADPLYAQEKPRPNTLHDLAIPSGVGSATIPGYAQVKLPNNAAYSSQVSDPRGKNLEPDSLGFPAFTEEKTSLLSDSAGSEACSQKEPGSHGNSASSDMVDVVYPEDLMKPNPAFGHPSSPIADKIGILNEDLSIDNVSAGAATEDYSDRSKENLLETTVPEVNELGENQTLNTAPDVAVETDELVYRPVSDNTVLEVDGSSYTAPPGERQGVAYKLNAIAQEREMSTPLSAPRVDLDNKDLPQETERSDADLSAEATVAGAMARDTVDTSPIINDTSFEGEIEYPMKNSSNDFSHPTEAYGSDKSWGQWTADTVNAKDTVASSDDQADDGVGSVDAERKTTSVADTNDEYPILDKSNENPREEGSNESWGKWTTDKLNNAKNTVTMTVGLGHENLPIEKSSYRENVQPEESQRKSWGKWTVDKLNNAKDTVTENVGLGGQNVSSEQPLFNEDVGAEPESNQEGWGKWSADKLNNAKDVVTTKAVSDGTNVAEQPSINGNAEGEESSTEGWGKWPADKLNSAMDVVVTKVGVTTSVKKPADDENVDELAETGGLGKVGDDADKKYHEEGLSLDNEDAEEEVLNASFAGAAIGKFQGLKATVASSLGHVNASSADPSYDVRSEPAGAGTFAEPGSKVESEEKVLQPSQQQTGGALQGLKNAVAAKLGYGSSEESPADAKVALEEPNHVTAAMIESVDDVGDERAGKDGDHQPSSYAQKLFQTTAAAREYLASKVGYGNNGNDSNDNNAASSRSVYGEEGDEKPIITSSSANMDQLEEKDNTNIKPSIASRLSPTEEDKALSQLITEKMSNTAAVLKQKLLSPRANQTPTVAAPHDDA